MTLLSVAEARALLKTSLTDVELYAVMEREEAALVERLGPHFVDANTSVTEMVSGRARSVFLRRRVLSVVSVTEDTTVLESDEYRVWGGQGRLERLPAGAVFDDPVTVVYVPANDNAKRAQALIDLVRLAIERTAMKSESVAGEYSYSAPEWDAERRNVYARLGFIGV